MVIALPPQSPTLASLIFDPMLRTKDFRELHKIGLKGLHAILHEPLKTSSTVIECV